jgi:hypothetical protein
VNSEELELSLRSEFEAQLRAVLADVQQQATDFQQKIDAEFEKHRAQIDAAVKEFSSRLAAERPVDQAFRESVFEHLRLARDDGARVAASAMTEAEAMGADNARSASFLLTRNAVNEISSQTSQSAILHTLVSYSEQFCPRGVFFIVRNEQFVGWHALGRDAGVSESTVRDLTFPVSSANVLSDAVRSLSTIEQNDPNNDANGIFLDPLGFGRPGKMYAIPLVARGRGVAVLYVDGGKSEHPVNIEALEMLVRVASLTVELLASNQAARPNTGETEHAEAKNEAPVVETKPSEVESPASFVEPPTYAETLQPAVGTPAEEYKFETAQQWQPLQEEPVIEQVPEYELESINSSANEAYDVQEIEVESESRASFVEEEAQEIQVEADSQETFVEADAQEIQVEAEAIEEEGVQEEPSSFVTSTDFAFTPSDGHVDETPVVESVDEEEPAYSNGHNEAISPVLETSAEPEATRTISPTRKLDLPIEVSEDERGTHTKARRFARLLVSEIKLYNEDKVREGREAGDLYDRLREAIDRSREMYDKRVEAPVSSRFDYFHYELVNDLAEGDAGRLGTGYPGSAV